MEPTIRSVPAGCLMTGDAELAVAHAVPHLVVSQVLRPDVAAFLESDKINVKTVHDAQCCVTAITVKTSVEHGVLSFASQLPHLTALTGRNVTESPSLSVLACLPPQLREVQWSHCQNIYTYASSFSSALANLPALAKLTLEDSACAQSVSTIFSDARTKFPDLRELVLSWSGSLDASALEQIATLPALEVLDLSYTNTIDADGFAHLAQHAHRLRHLNLSRIFVFRGCLNSVVLAHVSSIRSLRTLSIGSCYYADAIGFGHLSRLDVLQVLDLNSCSGVDAQCLEFVSKMTSLCELNLSHCIGVTSDGIRHIATLPRLRKLSLSQCSQIDTECLRHLSNAATLEELDLSLCRDVDAEGLMHLSKLPRLRELALYECSGVDGQAIIDHLVAMPSLRVLEVDGAAVDEVRSCLPKSLRVVV